jgi:hypothetical protein
MPLGLLDLSVVTYRLIDKLRESAATSQLWDEDVAARFTISPTGLAPEEARETSDGECQLSIYLFHVAADGFHRNTYPLGGSAQKNACQPFALTLYYLLTAYAKGSYIKEQQAMSIALKCFHEHPILPVASGEEEFTLTIEPQTVDEISRLWQAIAVPIRLSAIYRVGVIFLEAAAPRVADAVRHAPDFRPPRHVEPLTAAPTRPGANAQAYADPAGFATIKVEGADFVPGVTELKVRARPLAPTTSPPLGGEFQVVDDETLTVRVPLYTPKGRYLLTARPDPQANKLIEVELDVPEMIEIVEVIGGLAGVIIDDAGFAAGATTARIDEGPGTALVEVNAEPLAAGQFLVVRSEAVRLRIPSGTSSGRHLLTLGRGPELPDLELRLLVP